MKTINKYKYSNYPFTGITQRNNWIHVQPIHVAIREFINGLRGLSYCAVNNRIYSNCVISYSLDWAYEQNKKHKEKIAFTSEIRVYSEFINTILSHKEQLKKLPLACNSTFKKSIFKILTAVRHLAYYKDCISVNFMNEAADQYYKVNNSNATQRNKNKCNIDEIYPYLYFIDKTIWSGKINYLRTIPKPIPAKKLHD